MDARNKILFSSAFYNAGPGRVQKLRKEAKRRELGPNVWFNNVEIIAAQRIGEETVTYIASNRLRKNSIAGQYAAISRRAVSASE